MTPAAEVNPLISTASLRLEPHTAAHSDVMFQVMAGPHVLIFKAVAMTQNLTGDAAFRARVLNPSATVMNAEAIRDRAHAA